MDPGKVIRRQVKLLEAEAALIAELRSAAKTDGGRMTEFGRNVLRAAKDSELKQSFIAKLLSISPGAVSQHYSKTT